MSQDSLDRLLVRQAILDGVLKEPSARYVIGKLDEMIESAKRAALSEFIPENQSREFRAGQAHGLETLRKRIDNEREKNMRDIQNAGH